MSTTNASTKLSNYIYELPEERIAKFPVSPRDSSKLLVYRSGTMQHHRFTGLAGQLPPSSHLVFNNSKVIPARLHFVKDTGALVEVFLTEPEAPALVSLAMQADGPVVWNCLVGNKKRWKSGELRLALEGELILTASWHNRELNQVQLSWNDDSLKFADIVELSGKIPLPPYLNREAEQDDKTTYQTVYAEEKGAVAAPTAGLHFTDGVLNSLTQHDITTDFLTLHVGAGTFKPVTVDDIYDHDMHTEQLRISKQNVEGLLDKLGNIIAVGTTSMRVLESLYWFGTRLLKQEADPFKTPKLYAYQVDDLPSSKDALQAVLDYMTDHQLDHLDASTQIMIIPGYSFKVCRGLITNYHQPGSTLVMLVAAFVGNNWHHIYKEALDNNYRFLSYGDSSLLLP